MLWRVTSAVLTGSAVLSPVLLLFLLGFLKRFGIIVLAIILQVYVMSRLLLLVEAFISLRDFTPECSH